MKHLFPLLSLLSFGACLMAPLPTAVAREPQREVPEARSTPKLTPKGYDLGIKVEPLAVTSETADGARVIYPTTKNPEVRILRVTIPPGAETGWHTHPLPAYGYVISGSITVELADGRKNTFKAGDAVVEVVNTLHNGVNSGSEPTVILMVITGEKGTPVTVAGKKPEAQASE